MSESETLASERLLDGKVFDVDRDRVRMPNGREVTVDVVRHPRSVVLIPVPQARQVILVRQYRHAVKRWLWELPAGSVDKGEEPADAARRECNEEIGKIPGTVVRLAALYPTPGFCDEEMIFFRLSDFTAPATPAVQDEDEDIEAKVFAVAEARDMIRRGEIIDMKTVAGLTLL